MKKLPRVKFVAILLVFAIMVTSFPLNVFAVDNSKKQEELDDIIPNPEENIEKPSEDYVNVSFASYRDDVNTTPAQNTGGKIVYEGKEYEKISFWVKKGVKYSQLMKEIVPSDDYYFKPTAEDAKNRPSVKIADKKALDFISWSPGLGYHGNRNGDGEIVDETVEAAITRIEGKGKESVTHHAKWAAPILPYTPSDPKNPVNDTDTKTEKDKLPENYVELYKVIGFNTDGNGKLVVKDKEKEEEKEAQSYLVLYKLKWHDIQNIIPETKGKPDFTFDKWDPEVLTTGAVANKSSYKALFKDERGIIPDPDNNIEKPGEDYLKVHFLLRDDDKNANAATLKGVEHFWVEKGTDFPLEKAPTIVPNEPYKVGQKLWNPMLPVVINEDTDIYAVLMKDGGSNTQEPVIPVSPVNPDEPFNPEIPDDKNNGRKTEEDQVRIIFYAGENGNFGLYNESKTDPKTEIKKVAYDVKKGTAWTTVIDYVPMINPHEGYEVANPEWKPVLPDYSVLVENGEKEFHAQYVAISEKPDPDIIPTTPEDKDKDDPNPGEEATHVLVTFDKGDHGELAGKRMFWVKKGTAGSDLEAQAPQIVPNAGYDVANPSWDPAVPETIDEESTHVAQYVEKEDDSENIIPDPDNNIPKPSEDYVKVTFLPGNHGKLNGERMFWVKKGTNFPSNMAPQITPNSGYSVVPQRWNPTLPMLIKVDTTFTAVYNKDASTNIPEVPTPQPQPEPKPQEPIYWEIFIPVTAPKEKLEMDSIHHAYIFGYLNGTVRPDGKITRAEAAAMLARLKGLDLDNGFAPNFKDTKNDAAWYNKVINAVVKAGYMRGYPDGTFKPENPITRAEFAQMIMPIDKANSAVAPFEDVKGHWGEVAINQGYGNKRLHGYPDGTFRPDADITRAEAAKIFNRLFDRLVTEQGLRTLENPKDLKHFTDLDTRHWGYYELLEATNTHEYFRLEKGGVEEGWIRVLNH